ncbi:DNA polymerase III, delta subunit [Candidatus Phytoplasma australiense]|uniref:DNA-directed DNA polymerase n=1 Tax=Phytoplasma australiense TaxID=59748 RepID=B1V948_PHYAS|nr:DNA polymerase III, delta subunit [Candidatus Phytoplasma australiense]
MSKNNIYLISGKQRFFLEQKIKKLIITFQNQSLDVVHYRMQKDADSDLEKELKVIPLLHKVIIVDQSEILLQKKKKELTFLNSYFQNPSPKISLYFFVENGLENNENFQLFQKYCSCETIVSLEKNDFFTYVAESFEKEGFQIEKKAIYHLLKETNYNLFFLHQEIKKLKLCQLEEKTITYPLVEKLNFFQTEDNLFHLINLFLNNNRIGAYELYQKFKKHKNNAFQILYQLTNKIKALLLVKNMVKQNYNQEKISQILKCSPAKAFLLTKEAQVFKNTQFLQASFLTLIELEYQSKIGSINLDTGLEFFFLGKNILPLS